MGIRNIIILIAGLLNIILGIIVLSKNHKNPANFWFFMLCLFGGGWGIMKAVQLLVLNVSMHDLWISRMVMFFGIMAPISYFMLAYNFPYKIKIFSREKLFYIFSIPVIISVLTLLGILRHANVSIVDMTLHREIIFWDFLIFSVYYFIYVFSGLILLVNKYLIAEGISKDQIKYLLIATIGTFITVGFVSVVLLLFNNFNYDWLGAVLLLLHFSVAGFLIFIKSRLDN